MEATHIGIRLWKQAVEQAGSFAPEKVRAALGGQSLRAPSGVEVNMDEQNHHLHQPVFIGRIRQDGQFDVIWQSPENIRAIPLNPHYQAQ
jgi:urea transport system substrate-binding protein